MPQGKTYSKLLHKWVDKKTHNSFDYEGVDQESASMMISFFRAYPDYFADTMRSPNAQYQLELPQRIMMRILVRYRNVYITGVRGLTKTYIFLLSRMIVGVLYPGVITRYTSASQRQAAALATQAFHQIERDYPAIAAMWQVRNDRDDKFVITTKYGSEFSMYAPKGSNASAVCAEEIAQEGKDAFPMNEYESIILPTVRHIRQVNQKEDTIHIPLQHSHITNASTRQNRAFSVHRANALLDMLYGDELAGFDGYVIDIPWEVAVLCNIRTSSYIDDQRKSLTANAFLREMCALYAGNDNLAMVADETLTRSRTLMAMEDKHCGDNEAIYIVSVDYSFVDGARNAKCGLVVVKLTKYTTVEKRDKYRKDVVYVDSYSPPKSAYEQAQKVKSVWARFAKSGAQTTYLVMDERNGGILILPELMKPTSDGLPPLCCVGHIKHQEIEQPNALPVIYPIAAGRQGSKDDDGEMIRYAQVEFEQGNVRLLTSTLSAGIEQYKRKNKIKDSLADGRIAYPYRKTNELCQQIQNLSTTTTGTSIKEVRKSSSIQRDIWSALKYALRMAFLLEQDLVRTNYAAESSWTDYIRRYKSTGQAATPGRNMINDILKRRKS